LTLKILSLKVNNKKEKLPKSILEVFLRIDKNGNCMKREVYAYL